MKRLLVSTSISGRVTTIDGGAVESWTEEGILDKIAAHIISDFGRVSNGIWSNVYTVAMHPQCAKQLAEKGYSKQDVQKYLFEKSKIPYEKISSILEQSIRESIANGRFEPSASPMFEEALKPGRMVPNVQTPDYIDIIVASGEAGYTIVIAGGTNPNC